MRLAPGIGIGGLNTYRPVPGLPLKKVPRQLVALTVLALRRFAGVQK